MTKGCLGLFPPLINFQTHSGLYLFALWVSLGFNLSLGVTQRCRCLRRPLSTVKLDRYCHLPPLKTEGWRRLREKHQSIKNRVWGQEGEMSGGGRVWFSGRLSPPGPNQSLRRAEEKCDVWRMESLMKNYRCVGEAGTVFSEGVWSLIAIFFIFFLWELFFNEQV